VKTVLRNILIVLFVAGSQSTIMSQNDSLVDFYQKTKDDSLKIQTLQQLVKANYSSPDEAIEYAKVAINLDGDSVSSIQLAKSHNVLAIAYYYKGDLIQCSNSLNKSLYHYSVLKDKSGMATCYNGIGVVKYDQGKLYESLQLYIKSLRIKEKLGDKASIAMTLNNVGNVYKDLSKFDKSLEYYKKSLKIKEEIDDMHGLAMTLNNIGLLYHNQSQFDKALEYYQNSLKVKREIEDFHGEAMTLNNIGLTYEVQEKFSKALPYYEQSIEIKERIGDQYGLAMSLINIATIYRATGNYSRCYSTLLKAEEIALKIGATTQLRDCYQRLYETHEQQNNTAQAYRYFKLFIATKDSMMNEESVKHIEKLQAQYENEKKQLIIQNLSKKEELQEAQIIQNQALLESERLTKISLLVGLGLCFVLIFLVLFYANQRKKNNEALTNSLEEKEVLLKEVHHRVKNNFQVISSLLNLHVNNTENTEVQIALSEAKDRISSMALVHEKLYRSTDLSKINMKDYISQLFDHLLDGTSLEVDSKIEVEDIFMDIDTTIPLGLIFNELITNSLKYAFSDNDSNQITIGITKELNKISVWYKDNGVGLPDDFDKDNLDSLGINLVQILVLQLHGNLEIKSEKGTQYFFDFRIS
jgi:two-component sensor histidine kinase/Tfp pilus assembly protein PilF